MKIGVVGIPGKWSTEQLADFVEKKTGYRLVIFMSDTRLDLEDGSVYYKDTCLNDLDAIIIKKISPIYSPEILDRLEILRHLYTQGTPIFSKPASIEKAVDRLTCTLELRRNQTPMPHTVITEDFDTAVQTVRKFGKAVFKPLFTSKARGMVVLEADGQEKEGIRAFQKNNAIFYIQKMVESHGRDFGLSFLGGKYIATYARVGQKGSWNTTTHFGGKYEPYEPSQDVIEMARKAQAPFDLDFTCVDVVETPDGPMVYEVSAFGGFRGLMDANGIDAAELFVNHVLGKMNRG